ncbi:O-antigen polymerase [Petrocella sp. FN5]|uniref:O-antigen polymerase n=1 Tax=Petrocella sp. FN5 TaxID=3032002 RepID=UPI0023DBE864|nr:O-antigen polymerase [Petrocella sp. FN5]MDF1616146.1 O-antigen ligase [Petrocella sp. FN5]
MIIKLNTSSSHVKYLFLIVMIIFSMLSTLMGINNQHELCFIFSLMGYLVMVIGLLGILKNYSNITLAYVFFMFLYTYSGVFSVIWGEGLHRIFNPNYEPSVFLILSNFAYTALFLGFIIFYKNNKNEEIHFSTIEKKKRLNDVLNKAIIFSWVAFSMEFINFLRVGGFNAVALGKAYYNSKLSQMVLTLPGSMMVTVSFVFFALYLGYKRKYNFANKPLKVFIFLFPVTTVLALYTLLGRRGSFVSLAIILVVGIYYFRPLRRIPFKIFLGALMLYFVLSILYSVRAHIGYYLFEQNDIVGLLNLITDNDRILNAIVPSQNEFGVAFGNFNEYYVSGTKILKLGETYIKSILLFIPSWIYPGEKPLQIVYEFRNIFFPSEAARGAIASTGFSFLLEAYMNFRIFGVIIVYFIVGVILAKLEKNRIRKQESLFFQSFYLSSIAVIGIFQRNAFGDIFSAIVIYSIILLIANLRIVAYKRKTDTLSDNCAIERKVTNS